MEETRGNEEMKKSVIIIRDLAVCLIILAFMIGGFFGAVLQTSYRHCPVTAAELAEVTHD